MYTKLLPSSSLRRSLQHSTVTGQEQNNFISFLRLKSSIHFLSMVYSEYLLLKCNNVAVPKVHWIYLAVIPSKSGQFGEKLQLSTSSLALLFRYFTYLSQTVFIEPFSMVLSSFLVVGSADLAGAHPRQDSVGGASLIQTVSDCRLPHLKNSVYVYPCQFKSGLCLEN